ncbi:hypothetical protein F0562_003579 [Nyssa sinensis]|uniref:Uncharacterized protein n=1 Tax=Nyssa sinensis TaxID=561372 RepID=A0A5J5BVW1_9ASTE|nr:hypothetical protein F0562_003579 [Nyssa sinensis]
MVAGAILVAEILVQWHTYLVHLTVQVKIKVGVGKFEWISLHFLLSPKQPTGTFLAVARYGSATPVPPSVISRGAGWLGVGTFLNGVLGSVTGTTASVENAGLLALTRAGSRRVIQISAGYMIFFSVVGVGLAIEVKIMNFSLCLGWQIKL